MKKIRVNVKNSKVIDGQLFITELKAISIKIKNLAENINWHNKVFHPNANCDKNPNVIAMSKNYFYIRASISTVGNGTHMPTIVRRFVKALRNSDATMQLHPFDPDGNDHNHILDTESLISEDPTSILT